ncbi:MAG: hypothetical protein ABGU93_08995 [Acetobacterium sp.]|uniref:hypothetical protein n=1 Tax=Acetobacterium sp. TaxID=1872094 RepID=UPI003242228A
MKIRIKDTLKNQQGSSLAFVLIFGMIIMIMVASLLAVANSDFTFTQETVESRQAYIDAKSVIEFGKIEINSREKELSVAYQALVAERNKEKPSATTIQNLTAEIAALENEVTTIYGNETNPAGTLSFSDDSTKTSFGKVFVEKSATAVNTTNTSQYIFKVETENLRRKLDYQVDYNYAMTTGGTGSGTGSTTVPDPQIIISNLNSLETELMTRPDMSGWKTTKIKIESWNQTPKTKCTIGEPIEKTYQSQYNAQINNDMLTVSESALNLKINEFTWPHNPSLNLTAKNICFEAYPSDSDGESTFNITAVRNATVPSEIRFTQNYLQTNRNNKTNFLKADHVIFEGDLTIANNSKLNIECDTLVVNGKIEINESSEFILNANNVIVEGDIDIKNAGKLFWNCDNILIKGNVNPKKSSAVMEFLGINYLQTGTINLASYCQLRVTGLDASSSQMNIGSINGADSDHCIIDIKDFWSFTCTGLSLKTNSTLNLESNIIKINGALALGPQIIDSVIKTQYFDCSGMTTIDDLTGKLSIVRIDYDEPLYVRFGGGYTQTQKAEKYIKNKKDTEAYSVNIGETDKTTNKGATLVVFGPGISKDNVGTAPIIMGNANNGYTTAYLNVIADDIWFDSTSITMVTDRIEFWYQGGSENNNKTNIHIGSMIAHIQKDSYLDVKTPSGNQQFPHMLKNNGIPDYNPPVFKNPPGSGGSSSVIITQGAEKYY